MNRVTAFLSRELKALALVTAYFLSWFAVIGYLKSLLLDEYNISGFNMSGAVVGALVIAKVVIVLDETSAGERFFGHAALAHIFYRSLIYTFFVVLVLILEKLVEAMLGGAALGAAAEQAWQNRNRSHIIFSVLLIGVAFLFYNIFSVVNRALGEGGLVGMLKSPTPRNAEH